MKGDKILHGVGGVYQDGLDSKFGNAQRDPNYPQSHVESRFDLVDPEAMLRLAHVLWYGAERYGVNNWRKIPQEQHIGRVIYHLVKHLEGDRTEDHLGHAFTRAMFAIGTDVTEIFETEDVVVESALGLAAGDIIRISPHPDMRENLSSSTTARVVRLHKTADGTYVDAVSGNRDWNYIPMEWCALLQAKEYS
jgi:hypothetical protein